MAPGNPPRTSHSDEEVVILPALKTLPSRIYRCPECGGTGHRPDGSMIVTQTEVRIRPATVCWVCQGKKLVMVTPWDGE